MLLDSALEISAYNVVIGASLIIILSYFCNIIAKKTNIPSVLLLIIIGISIKLGIEHFNVPWLDEKTELLVLEILGKVGLIFIVLEAALDLQLSRQKWPIIWKSAVMALLGLGISAFAIAGFLYVLVIDSFFVSLVYAIPLSILSSAIIIPSVMQLKEDSKEFMIYESTFSDIFGIMFFYLLLGNDDAETAGTALGNVGVNIGLTLVLSILMSYALTYILQRITGHLKLFLIIAVLLLLYALGSMYHLSPLILILIFGLMLNNHKVFWQGKLDGIIDDDKLHGITHEFHIITLETAFVIRTFFFVIFGVTIVLSSLLDFSVLFYSLVIVFLLYLVRWVLLKIFNSKNIVPLLYIAPRGLITILLYFQITGHYTEYATDAFDSGILLFVIIATSVIMTIALIQNGLDPNFSIDEISDQQLEDYMNGSFHEDQIVKPEGDLTDVEVTAEDMPMESDSKSISEDHTSTGQEGGSSPSDDVEQKSE